MPSVVQKRIASLCCLAWLACAAPARSSALPPQQPIAIADVTIIDVEHDRSFAHRTVFIDHGRITAITAPRNARIPANTLRLDGRGRFLIPGLVDMHVHLFNLSTHRPPNDWTFALDIANGVTAVREMRGDPATMTQVKQWREQLDKGEIVAPRILAAGIPAYGPTPDDARRQVDAAAEAGADFIKVFSEVTEANWRAILDEAHKRSLPVVGHVPAGVPMLVAAAAGQRTDEHLMQAFEACSSIEAELLAQRRDLDGDALEASRETQEARALAAFDPRTCRRISRALAATGQAQVPTLVLADEDSFAGEGSFPRLRGVRKHAREMPEAVRMLTNARQGRTVGMGGVSTLVNQQVQPSANPRWRYLRADERTRWQAFLAGYTANDAALAKRRWPVAQRIVSAMHQAGVTIMVGTDSPMPGVYPGYAVHEEMALLVASGLTPREALRAATLTPARFLGIDAMSGSVAVGKRADLILLDADPTREIRNTRRIEAVVIGGKVLRRRELDDVLEGVCERSTHERLTAQDVNACS